jgi:hypothetical protein
MIVSPGLAAFTAAWIVVKSGVPSHGGSSAEPSLTTYDVCADAGVPPDTKARAIDAQNAKDNAVAVAIFIVAPIDVSIYLSTHAIIAHSFVHSQYQPTTLFPDVRRPFQSRLSPHFTVRPVRGRSVRCPSPRPRLHSAQRVRRLSGVVGPPCEAGTM